MGIRKLKKEKKEEEERVRGRGMEKCGIIGRRKSKQGREGLKEE